MIQKVHNKQYVDNMHKKDRQTLTHRDDMKLTTLE